MNTAEKIEEKLYELKCAHDTWTFNTFKGPFGPENEVYADGCEKMQPEPLRPEKLRITEMILERIFQETGIGYFHYCGSTLLFMNFKVEVFAQHNWEGHDCGWEWI